MARASSGTLSSRNRSSAGTPACEAWVSGPSFTSRLFSCGARTASDFSVGVSCRAAGRSSSTSGLVATENRLTRSIVSRCATRKAGNTLIVAASALAWAEVAENARLELSTSCWSAAGERAIEENTCPPSRSSVLVAALSRFSTASTESTLVANG